MSSRTPAKQSRSTPKAKRPAATQSSSWWIGLAIVGLIAVLAVLAFWTTGDDGDDVVREPATVSGEALPALPESGTDPAVGRPAPTGSGFAASGASIDLIDEGRPRILLMVAHWCPVCQREVPVVQGMQDAGQWPGDVDLVTVSTAIEATQPNYPPEAWLEREGWTAPTIADPDRAVADAYGLTAFPFWVAVDADGTVVARTTGELGTPQIEQLIEAARG
jgi:cytochrome c biogenesis protein CcmG, thiol:disulfide interchange protein DsbE